MWQGANFLKKEARIESQQKQVLFDVPGGKLFENRRQNRKSVESSYMCQGVKFSKIEGGIESQQKQVLCARGSNFRKQKVEQKVSRNQSYVLGGQIFENRRQNRKSVETSLMCYLLFWRDTHAYMNPFYFTFYFDVTPMHMFILSILPSILAFPSNICIFNSLTFRT